MVTIKLKNVSVKSGDKFRNNQNYTMTFFKKDGIDETSTVDDIRDLIISKYSNRVSFNKNSQIEIVYVSPVSKTWTFITHNVLRIKNRFNVFYTLLAVCIIFCFTLKNRLWLG